MKLYSDISRLGKLNTLKSFYASLDASRVPFMLPSIELVSVVGSLLVAVERRLDGVPMAQLLAEGDAASQQRLRTSYFEAADALKSVRTFGQPDRYLIFDESGESERRKGTWHSFMLKLLRSKKEAVYEALRGDVSDFDQKFQTIESLFERPYKEALSLIHGDFFPGNVLCTTDGRTAAVIDFGTFTMFGDHIFDVATAWAFFRMYTGNDTAARAELLPALDRVVGLDQMPKVFAYALTYAVCGRIEAFTSEVKVVHHCNLSCRGCCHSSPIVPKRFLERIRSEDAIIPMQWLKQSQQSALCRFSQI